MQNIRDSKTICYVKVIQNSRVPESFDMRMTLYPRKKVDVTIVTPNKIQLGAIVQEMKKVYGGAKFAFRVQFNWANTSKDIQKDSFFKAEIYNIFQNNNARSYVTAEQYQVVLGGGDPPREINEKDPECLATYIDLVRTYIVDYGHAPDFTNQTEKGKKKTHNYIKSICGSPNMSLDTALLIVDEL